MVEFEGYLCDLQDVNVFFIEVYYQQMILLLDRHTNTIRKPTDEELEKIKSIDINNCQQINRHLMDELNMNFTRLYFTRFEPRVRCSIYRLNINNIKTYVAECYDGSAVIYRYDIVPSFEDAMAWIYD